MASPRTIVLFAAVCAAARAWLHSPLAASRRIGRRIRVSADDAPVADEGRGESDDSSSFGVSYIGGTYSDATFPCDGLLAVQANKQLMLSGDPCSSRYNTDPFDANEESFKPGFPVR